MAMNFENLPETWKIVRLGRVAEKITDGTHQTPKYVDKGIPFISTINLKPYCHDFDFSNYRKFITREEHERLIKRAKPEKGDLLVSKCGTIGITQLIRTDSEFSIFVGLALIKLKKKLILGEYLEFLFNWDYFRYLFESLSPGSNRKTLTINTLSNLSIPLPPLPEQKRIVEILSLAEELIRKQKEAIALIDKILMAKFLEMFGDPATNPKGWEVRKLGEVAEVKGGGTPSTKVKEYYEPPEIDWITITDVTSNPSIYQKCSKHKISKKGLSKSNAKLLPINSIIVSIAATIGEVKILKKEMATNQQFYAVCPCRYFTPEYLAFLLKNMFQELLKKSGTTTFKFVNMTQFRNFSIPLPPIELQKQFAQIMEEFEKKMEKMQKTLEILESLFKFLQKKAFTGELTAEWREQNRVEWELPRITERQAVLLASLYYHESFTQKPTIVTVAVKSAFLLQQEAGLNLGYNFIPYKYGPFSKEIYEDIEALEKNLLVERIKPKKDIEMTEIRLSDEFKDWTERIINNLPQKIKDAIKTYTEKYGKMELKKLLDYVYAKYPEYVVKSKRKRN